MVPAQAISLMITERGGKGVLWIVGEGERVMVEDGEGVREAVRERVRDGVSEVVSLAEGLFVEVGLDVCDGEGVRVIVGEDVCVSVGIRDAVSEGVKDGVKVGEIVGVGLFSKGSVEVGVSSGSANTGIPFANWELPKRMINPINNILQAGSRKPAARFIVSPLNQLLRATIF